MSGTRYDAALRLIDEAHACDPRIVTVKGEEIPYELLYGNKMTYFLEARYPDAPETLRLAIRSQHLRRWEVPRDSYPMNRSGYHSWRTFLKKRQADLAAQICLESGYSTAEALRVGALIRKEDLKKDKETQVLEDVACLVFLEDQLEEFEKKHDEEKIVNILRKTWIKMSDRGHELALKISMSEHARALVLKALSDK